MFLARVSPTFRTAFGCVGKQWLTLKDAQLSLLRPHFLCATPGFRIQKVREMSSGQMSSREEAKRLTVRMKVAPTAVDFLDVLDDVVDRRVFNTYHAGVAYHSMAKWKKQGELQVSDKIKPLVCRLNDRVLSSMANGQLDAQTLANILWSLVHLADVLPNSSQMLRATVAQVPSKVKEMNAQETANCLWAAATLRETLPVVLKMVPTLLAEVPLKAKEMNAQDTATCLSQPHSLTNWCPML